MAITGPWVGSSAKAETGESWMRAAATAVRIGGGLHDVVPYRKV